MFATGMYTRMVVNRGSMNLVILVNQLFSFWSRDASEMTSMYSFTSSADVDALFQSKLGNCNFKHRSDLTHAMASWSWSTERPHHIGLGITGYGNEVMRLRG